MGTEIDMQDVKRSCGAHVSAVEPRKRRLPLALLAALACALTLFGGDGGPERLHAQTVLTCTILDATDFFIDVKADGSACFQGGNAAGDGRFYASAGNNFINAGTIGPGNVGHNGCTSTLGDAAAGEACIFFGGPGVQSVTANFTSTFGASITVSVTGTAGGVGLTSFSVTVGASGETVRSAATVATAQGAIAQTSGLVAGRVASFNRGTRSGVARGGVPQTAAVAATGLIDLSVGRDGTLSLGPEGTSAGDEETGWGVWANVAWSGINDTTAVAGVQGNMLTGIAGADYKISDGVIVGGAVSVGGASFDSQVASFDTEEVSVGVNPYLAYQITDVFSLDAVAGYSFGVGDSTRNETITGHYGIHRYYTAVNASSFQTWDAFSLMASTGVLWGQSFENAYTESDGTRVGSRRADIGTVKLLLQPSYIFEADRERGLFLEPYLVSEYSYDYTLTRITGHSNDRDALRLGLGLNIFSDIGVSGNLEATSTVLRENQRTVSVLGTVRYDF
ncbi:MAG: autotransporter domain-containing protein [Pseudomonadota bacterium]